MEKTKSKSTGWKIISLVLAIALIAVSTCFAVHLKGEKAQQESEKDIPKESAEETVDLSLWNDSAAAKAELLSYVKAVTAEGSPDFIPEEDRIAVFDLDGTLACETDPCYFDHCIYYSALWKIPIIKTKRAILKRK